MVFFVCTHKASWDCTNTDQIVLVKRVYTVRKGLS